MFLNKLDSLLKLALLLSLLGTISGYKLNVPKVLLPFHSSNVINFTLELINEDEDLQQKQHQHQHTCFTWSTSRPEIVSIEPIYESNGQQKECSTRAVVSAISKYAQRLTSIIMAKEATSDKLIRCDVIIDKIVKVSIKHTTTQLYLEDSPECFVSEAFDLEGNTFTSIEGLPFDWIIVDTDRLDSHNVLNMQKFIDSEYQVSDTIKNIELTGQYGNKVLIDGVKTGTANVQAKLVDPYYKGMSTDLVRLLVVANILLEPSYPIYLLVGTSIKYRVILIKQTSMDEIPLPSAQYYFESKNSSCANLKPLDTAVLFASFSPCETNVVLVDRNMKQFAEQYIPPTSDVTVVEANYLKFHLRNYATTQFQTTTWVLEIEKAYEIEVYAYTSDHKQIYPSDNVKFDTLYDLGYFNIIKSSQNGSYFHVYAKKPGSTQAKTSLNGVYDSEGKLFPFKHLITGKQDIELLTAIKVHPKLLIFAWRYQAPLMYEYQLQATGGSGLYQWQSKNTSIVMVSNTGYLKLNNRFLANTQDREVIETLVYAYDQKNANINDFSRVLLLEPVQLDIQKCPIESNINKTLNLRLQMHAMLNGEKVAISDCSKLNFKVWLQNENIFKFVRVESKLDTDADNDGSCAIVNLQALAEGSTLIRVSYEVSADVTLESEQIIYSYSSLKTSKSFYLLNHLSSYVIRVQGGLYLAQQQYMPGSVEAHQKLNENLWIENEKLIDISKRYDSKLKRNSYKVKCKEESGETRIKLQISNELDVSLNKCPLKFEHEFRIKCAKPFKFELSQLLLNKSKLGYLPECPFKPVSTPSSPATTNVVIAHCKLPLNVEVKVKDENGHEFDNFTSIRDRLEWHIAEKSLLGAYKDKALNQIEIDGKLVYYSTFQTKSLIGEVNLEAKFKHLNAKLFVKLVDNLKVLQNNIQMSQNNLITIINHPTNTLNLQITQGSGYYYATIQQITDSSSKKIVDFNLNENNLVVKPLNIGNTVLNIYDYCILQSEINESNGLDVSNEYKLQLQVTDINTIQVEAVDNKVELGKYLILYVQINDASGNRLKKSLFSLMNLKYKLNNNNANLKLITPEVVNTNDEFYLQLLRSTTQEQLNYEKIVKLGFGDEFTAMYILHAQKNDGLITVQFEANLNNGPLIQSKQIDIVVYSPLNVQPKKLDLVIGSTYQLKFNGGPELNEYIFLKYDLLNEILADKRKSSGRLLNVHQNGTINALNNGNVTINIKIVSPCNDNNINNYKLCELIRVSNKDPQNLHQVVYAFDNVHVNVVQLRTVHIDTPIRYVKVGNRMPMYLQANRISEASCLKPSAFGSSDYLVFKWSINNQNFASLESNLVESGLDLDLSTAFSIVFNALQVGTVRVSVQVTALVDGIMATGNTVLVDHLEVTIIDAAKFTSLNNNFNSLILTPGSSLQLKTNRDQSARRLSYELHSSKFMNEDYLASQEVFKQQQSAAQQQQQYVQCSNNTISVDAVGVLKVDKNLNLNQYKHQTCIAVALVRIEEEFKKQQYLYYLIQVKPVKYFMFKSKSSIQLDSGSLSSLPLDLDLHLKLHYYDDLGDEFFSIDTGNLKLNYDLNRNDLIELSEKAGLIQMKASRVGSTLLSITNLNQKLDVSDYYLRLVSNRINLFKNMELSVHQMDVIELNHNYLLKYQQNRETKTAEVIEYLNENHYYWSYDQGDDDAVRFLNTQQSFAFCLRPGTYELELRPKKQNLNINFAPLKVTIKEIQRVEVSTGAQKSFIFSESLEMDVVFDRIENHLKQLHERDLSGDLSSEINEYIGVHYIGFECLFKFADPKTHSQTQKQVETENYLKNLLVFRPKFRQNSWLCELGVQQRSGVDLEHVYGYLVNLYRPTVVLNQPTDYVEEVSIPKSIHLWSSVQTHDSPKLKLDFYLNFALTVSELRVNINNLFLNVDEKVSLVSRQLNKLRIENNFHTKFFVYAPENLNKLIDVRTSHSNVFKIKALNYTRQELKLYFDIELIEFNLENLIQANLDEMFIEISCDFTKQNVKLPIRLHFDKGFNLVQDKHGFLQVTSNIQTSAGTPVQPSRHSGILSGLYSLDSSQIINYLAIISLILFIVLFLLKLKLPPNANQPAPMQPHRLLNGSGRFSPPQRIPTEAHSLPGLRYRGGTAFNTTSSPFNTNNYSSTTTASSTSPFSTTQFSPPSPRNDIRLYSIDSDAPAYAGNDSTRYYSNDN